ncbi:MAG: glycosyltransferase family 39 protein [Acidobacteriaceae bacterium]|nr:glycosyltransferase family 39 protein [Acidobacteriaceae bacterium]
MVIPSTKAAGGKVVVMPPGYVERCVLLSKVAGAILIFTCPLWLGMLFFTSPQEYSYASSLLLVPMLALVTAVIALHLTQGDPYLRGIMMVGLVLHIAASSIFIWVSFVVYNGVVDAFHYWSIGRLRASQFAILGWSAFPAPYWGTNLIYNLSGVATLLLGDALPALFVVFSLLSLAGSYLFYRAFRFAFPSGDRWLFGLLALLMPSVLFWSSFVGKDALMQLFIAASSLGFARVAQRHDLKGFLLCAVGLSGAWIIRPHIAAMLAIAMTFPYAANKSNRVKRSVLVKAVRIVLIPALVIGTYTLIHKSIRETGSLLDSRSGHSPGAVEQVDMVSKNSQIGGSSFSAGASLLVRVAESPFLLFRPFPWEMTNSLAIVSVIESAAWIFLSWTRRRELWLTLKRWREPYIGFLFMYSVIFLITFGASIGNFGILLRERIMLTPLALMILSITPRSSVARVTRKTRKNHWLGHSRHGLPVERIPA